MRARYKRLRPQSLPADISYHENSLQSWPSVQCEVILRFKFFFSHKINTHKHIKKRKTLKKKKARAINFTIAYKCIELKMVILKL